jgi:alanine-synthesizing transaminase
VGAPPVDLPGVDQFAKLLITECDVAVSVGIGFGPASVGFVRFALVENEQRTRQAVHNLKRGLTKL